MKINKYGMLKNGTVASLTIIVPHAFFAADILGFYTYKVEDVIDQMVDKLVRLNKKLSVYCNKIDYEVRDIIIDNIRTVIIQGYKVLSKEK